MIEIALLVSLIANIVLLAFVIYYRWLLERALVAGEAAVRQGNIAANGWARAIGRDDLMT